MAKTIIVKTKWFEISANVAIIDAEGCMRIDEYSDAIATTANKRELTKSIKSRYEERNCDVLAIRDIVATPHVATTKYRVDATALTILDACRAYGISVEEVIADEADADEDTADADDEC